jgi:hypothetical protein
MYFFFVPWQVLARIPSILTIVFKDLGGDDSLASISCLKQHTIGWDQVILLTRAPFSLPRPTTIMGAGHRFGHQLKQ